ncbi:hypothetical protein ACSYAD_30580 [Acaryochloris marina NIES-2412]|uniref:hypothetical protein n=1 Tax=Acaryochloris marina TaxID=155978 RepID=UPI004058DE57
MLDNTIFTSPLQIHWFDELQAVNIYSFSAFNDHFTKINPEQFQPKYTLFVEELKEDTPHKKDPPHYKSETLFMPKEVSGSIIGHWLFYKGGSFRYRAEEGFWISLPDSKIIPEDIDPMDSRSLVFGFAAEMNMSLKLAHWFDCGYFRFCSTSKNTYKNTRLILTEFLEAACFVQSDDPNVEMMRYLASVVSKEE